MFENSFNTSKSLNNIGSVIVQVPQLSIMSLVRPPKGILFQNLVLLEVCSHPPSFIISQCVSILLKQCVNAWYSSIPRIFQIFKGQTSVLCLCFLPFQCIFCPDSLRINEFTLPRLYIAIKIGNQLVLLMAHPTPEVGYTNICLLAIPKVTLWNQNMTHGQHSEPSNFFGSIEDDRWKPARHL